MQSSMIVPSSVSNAEYWACPSLSLPTSLDVSRLTNALRSGPVTSNSPMCERSNNPTDDRTASCSPVIPPG